MGRWEEQMLDKQMFALAQISLSEAKKKKKVISDNSSLPGTGPC